jgi:hypothetical protein
LALISANALSAAVQGQFMFVLPWMLLSRGSSPQVAALSTAFLYVPMLLTAAPAGAWSDGVDTLRLLRWVTGVSLAACSLYPLATLAGVDQVGLVLLAAVVVGVMRNLSEGGVFRALADTTDGPGLLRAHAIRTTVNQAALFGSAFVGLLLYRFGGVTAVLLGMCLLYLAALAILAVVPLRRDHPKEPGVLVRDRLADGMASLRNSPRLRKIGWVTLTWSLFCGAAIGIMPAVLREHIGMNEIQASATFVAGGVAVVFFTLPIVRVMQRRLGAIFTFVAATIVQGTSVLLLAGANIALAGAFLYCLFLLSNSAAAASLGGARAATVDHEHQGLLNLAVGTIGLLGFVGGVVIAAGLLGLLGFGLVLALVGVGMAATALGFRRSLAAA